MRRLGLLVLVALAALTAACAYETKKLPPVLPTPSENSSILARDGTLITVLQAEENRENLALDRMPEQLVDAVIAIEDARFYTHNGVDVRALLRAASSNAAAGEVIEGGSTITQQYVKNVYLDDDRTVSRKVEEAALALQLERTYSKDLILELYLNTIYFGRGRYGVQAASYEYFGTPATELTLSQAALLAGMIQAPSAVDPAIHPAAALERRDHVLDRMLELGMINEAQHARATDTELPSRATDSPAARADRYPAAYFVEEVKQWIINDPRFGDTRDERINLLFGGGLRIHTTIDLELQARAEAAVAQVLPDPTTYPDAAVVTMDPSTGQVLAMVGGRDYFGQAEHAKYNLARGKGRQSGSAFKPIVLATALEQGRPIVTTYNGPGSISIPRPEAPTWNVSGGCGTVTLVEATVQSCNTVFAQLIMDVGAANAIDMAERLGIGSELQSNEAAVLGTNDVTPLDMASAFSTFANHGYHVPPTFVNRIVKADGTVLYERELDAEPVLDPPVADLVTWTLEQVVQRGTGTRAQLPGRPAAGKTGTTEHSWDAWFVGYTPQLVTAVWVGFPQAQIPMTPPTTPITVFGGTWPAEIWRLVMEAAHEGLPVEDFPDPPPEIFIGVGSSQEYIDNRHVPNVLGLPVARAVIELARAGYLAEISWKDSPGEVDGEAADPRESATSQTTAGTEPPSSVVHYVVLDQYPAPGEVHRIGEKVVLRVSRPARREGEPRRDEDLVLETLTDFYNLVSPDLNEGPTGEIRPEDEAVG